MPEDTREWTVGQLLEWTQTFFEKKEIVQPRLEAEILLAHVLGVERIDLYLKYTQTVEGEARTRFRELVRRRAEREPTRYLVGGCEFMSLAFQVTPDCLIPRPETELLVEEVLQRVGRKRTLAPEGSKPQGSSAGPPVWVIDLCTGCGCVAVSLAVHVPGARVVATDLSAAALEVARANAAAHGVSDRVTFLEGDLYDAMDSSSAAPADFLLANPPYVAEAEWNTLAPEIRDHEPRQALVAGREGTEIIQRILAGAPDHLKPGGILLVEIGAGQGAAVREKAEATRGLTDIEIRRDYAGHDRILVARLEAV